MLYDTGAGGGPPVEAMGLPKVGGGAMLVTILLWPYLACSTGSDAEEPKPSTKKTFSKYQAHTNG
jgi:hypothetical protein